jgi:hypothetical protein
MADINADDSMGVAVEVSIPDTNDNDISDFENDSDFHLRQRLMLLAPALLLGLLKHVKLNSRTLLAVPPRSRLMPLLQFYGPPRRGHRHYIRQLRGRQPLPFPHFNHFFNSKRWFEAALLFPHFNNYFNYIKG